MPVGVVVAKVAAKCLSALRRAQPNKRFSGLSHRYCPDSETTPKIKKHYFKYQLLILEETLDLGKITPTVALVNFIKVLRVMLLVHLTWCMDWSSGKQ